MDMAIKAAKPQNWFGFGLEPLPESKWVLRVSRLPPPSPSKPRLIQSGRPLNGTHGLRNWVSARCNQKPNGRKRLKEETRKEPQDVARKCYVVRLTLSHSSENWEFQAGHAGSADVLTVLHVPQVVHSRNKLRELVDATRNPMRKLKGQKRGPEERHLWAALRSPAKSEQLLVG